MNYPYPDTEIGRELTAQFHKKFGPRYLYGYRENGVGTPEVKQYPATPLHIELYPELYNFTFSYYKSYIVRNFSGVWCGYVYHEAHPLNFDVERELRVHGGITFYVHGKIGFDCGHAGDANPFENSERCLTREEALATGEYWRHKVYCDREYVMGELQHLSQQLFEKLPEWTPFTHKVFPKLYRERMVKLYMLWYLPSQLRKLGTKHLWTKILGHLSLLER